MIYPTKDEIEKARDYILNNDLFDPLSAEHSDLIHYCDDMVKEGWSPTDIIFGILIGLKIAENRDE